MPGRYDVALVRIELAVVRRGTCGEASFADADDSFLRRPEPAMNRPAIGGGTGEK